MAQLIPNINCNCKQHTMGTFPCAIKLGIITKNKPFQKLLWLGVINTMATCWKLVQQFQSPMQEGSMNLAHLGT